MQFRTIVTGACSLRSVLPIKCTRRSPVLRTRCSRWPSVILTSVRLVLLAAMSGELMSVCLTVRLSALTPLLESRTWLSLLMCKVRLPSGVTAWCM